MREEKGTKTPDRPPQLLAEFHAATSLGLRLVTAGSQSPVWACENAFCKLLRVSALPAAPCLALRAAAAQLKGPTEWRRRCVAGLEHVVIPLPEFQGRPAWIECGQVFLSPPPPRHFEMLRTRLTEVTSGRCLDNLERAYLATPILNPSKLAASLQLLRRLVGGISLSPTVLPQPCMMPAADPVAEIQAIIKRNPGEPLGLSELAAQVRLSPAYLCRLVRRQTGGTVGNLLTEARVQRAKQLLTGRIGRVTDVAYRSGFESVRQFNHVFKAHTGFTPMQFRQEVRALECGPSAWPLVPEHSPCQPLVACK